MCVLRRFEGNASGTGNNGPSHLLWHWIQLPECPQPTAITRSRRIKCWGVANEIQPPNINLIFEIKSRKGFPCVLVLISNTRPGCFPSPELLRARELQQLHSCWPVCTWSTDASVIANDARCNLRIPHPEPKRNGSAWKRQISIICPLWRVAGMPRGRTFLGAALSSRLSLLSLWYSPLMSGICEGFEGSVLGHKSSCLEDGPQAS